MPLNLTVQRSDWAWFGGDSGAAPGWPTNSGFVGHIPVSVTSRGEIGEALLRLLLRSTRVTNPPKGDLASLEAAPYCWALWMALSTHRSNQTTIAPSA
jgi:hypothetical protein